MMKVLFLCTGNSCRSIMAEAILNCYGSGRFIAFSAGSNPLGHVSRDALKTLEKFSIPIDGLSSKSWNEFKNEEFDIVITVCDAAAGQTCPVYLGRAIKAHWPVFDPSSVKHIPLEAVRQFAKCYKIIEERIIELLDIKFDKLTDAEIKKELDRIGNE